MVIKDNKILLRLLMLGLLMLIIGIMICRESSFIISGLGIVIMGISTIIYFNQKKE